MANGTDDGDLFLSIRVAEFSDTGGRYAEMVNCYQCARDSHICLTCGRSVGHGFTECIKCRRDRININWRYIIGPPPFRPFDQDAQGFLTGGTE